MLRFSDVLYIILDQDIFKDVNEMNTSLCYDLLMFCIILLDQDIQSSYGISVITTTCSSYYYLTCHLLGPICYPRTICGMKGSLGYKLLLV